MAATLRWRLWVGILSLDLLLIVCRVWKYTANLMCCFSLQIWKHFNRLVSNDLLRKEIFLLRHQGLENYATAEPWLKLWISEQVYNTWWPPYLKSSNCWALGCSWVRHIHHPYFLATHCVKSIWAGFSSGTLRCQAGLGICVSVVLWIQVQTFLTRSYRQRWRSQTLLALLKLYLYTVFE